jgi:hypothetical protein
MIESERCQTVVYGLLPVVKIHIPRLPADCRPMADWALAQFYFFCTLLDTHIRGT